MSKTKTLERLWKDTFRLLRQEYVENEWGEEAPSEVEVYTNKKCKLSNKIIRATVEGIVPISTNQYKIFTYPSLDLRQNDIMVVTRAGRERKFKISEPFIYDLSHSEIVVDEVIEGSA